jgi:hypothetical protein
MEPSSNAANEAEARTRRGRFVCIRFGGLSGCISSSADPYEMKVVG